MSEQIKLPPTSIPREPASKIESIKDQPLVSDTSKVIKPNDKDTLAQNKSDNSTSFHYQSISAKTMRLLASQETATQVLKRLLLNEDAMGLMKSGSADGIQMSNFLEAFFITLDQLPEYLQNQLSNSSLFQGDFFDMLRQLMLQNSNNSQIYDTSIQLLKSMEAYQNRENTISFLISNLNNLLPYLSKQNQQDILNIIGQLSKMPNSLEQLSSLRKGILDILGQTAAQNKDNQILRNMIMQSVHNLTRLDNSEQDSLTKLFHNLLNRLQQYSKLPTDQLTNFQNAFQKHLHNNVGSHFVTDQVLASLDHGLSAESPLAVQLASSNMLSSLLLNHSILLPLIYGFIPLRLEDHYLFSEYWAYVEEDNDSASAMNDTAMVKIFFTLESTVFGLFQGVLQNSGKKITVSLEAPEMALPYLSEIHSYLTPVFKNLGYELTNTEVNPFISPKKFYDVFGKKILREAYLNVQI